MIRRKGMLYYTEQDILDLFYKTAGAWELSETTNNGTFSLTEVRDGLKWYFDPGQHDNLSLARNDFGFVAVPVDVIEAVFFQRTYANMLTNPILTAEKKEAVEKMIESQEDFLDSKELAYINGKKDIVNEPCYIWFFKGDALVGVFNASPSTLLKGPLNPKIIYICTACRKHYPSSGDIPDLYYDTDNQENIYCEQCAGRIAEQKIAHMGE